jgi:hypothetical protein
MDKRKGYAAPEEKELARKTQKEAREVDYERQRAIDHLLRSVKPKAKGPNPLSMMKSKKGKGGKNGSGEKKMKKKRKRNRTRSGIKKPPTDTAVDADAMDVAEDSKVEEKPEGEAAVDGDVEKAQKKKRHRKRKRTRAGVKRRKLSEDDVAIESADEVDSSFSGASSDEEDSDSSDESGSESSSGESSGEEDAETSE